MNIGGLNDAQLAAVLEDLRAERMVAERMVRKWERSAAKAREAAIQVEAELEQRQVTVPEVVRVQDLKVGDTFECVIEGQQYLAEVQAFSRDRRAVKLIGDNDFGGAVGWIDCDRVEVLQTLEVSE